MFILLLKNSSKIYVILTVIYRNFMQKVWIQYIIDLRRTGCSLKSLKSKYRRLHLQIFIQSKVSSYNTALANMQSDVNAIVVWTTANRLNPNKIKAINFGIPICLNDLIEKLLTVKSFRQIT